MAMLNLDLIKPVSQDPRLSFYAEDVEFMYSRAAAYMTSFGITVS
jgi:hypothetical protein